MLYSGILLGNLREQQGISQEELSEGLCSKVHLFRIETGEREAEKLLFESLYQRLGKYSGRYETLLDNNEYSLQEKRWKLCQLIDDGKYENARLEIEDYKKLTDSVIHMQYLCLMECEIMDRTGESVEACMLKLEEAIGYTRTDFELDRMEAYYLSRMEMLIIEQYVRYMEVSGHTYEAVLYYHRILGILDREYYDRSERNLQGRYVAYNLMKHYFDNKDYDMALHVANKAWEYTIGNNYIVFLAEVKECILSCLEAQGRDMSDERRILKILKRFNDRFGVMSAEDYFPRYAEERVYNVNEIIKQRRCMNKMTQEQLAADICEVTSIWRMEKGMTTLQRENKEKLLKMIKLSGDKYIANVDSYDINVFECINKISDAMYSGNMNEAESYIKGLEAANVEWELNSKQYIAIQKYSIKMIQGAIQESDIEEIKLLLEERGIDIKAKIKDVILLNNEYALLYAVIKFYEQKKEYEICRNIIQYLLSTYKEYRIKNCAFIYIAVRTICGDVFGGMKQIEEANAHILKGLQVSSKRDVMSHIRGLCYAYAWNILEEKSSISIQETNDCREFLEYAYALCKVYGNTARAKKCIDIANKHYIILDV